MAGSLSVFKLINVNNKNKIYKNVDSNEQQTLNDFKFSDGLGQPRSKLTLVSHDEKNNRYSYKATHYSDSVKNKIRFFLADIIEDTFLDLEDNDLPIIKSGMKSIDEYQEVYNFDVTLDFNTNEIFIFAKKSIARSFIKRFKKSGRFDYKMMYFDMGKIENIPELDNIWGLWEDSSGRCKKKAYFGTEVHKIEGLKTEMVTSYNVKYEFNNENLIDLSIMRDCRLSSRSKQIGNSELFETYIEIKKHLGISYDDGDIIGVFQEED